nr:hypothetical protein HK105_006311 [Polyrhizophydium stewartii]
MSGVFDDSMFSLRSIYFDIDAFRGQPPPRIHARPTDTDRECIPRAIAHDPVRDVLLREEGYSGRPRRQVVQELAPLRRANPGIEEHMRSRFHSTEYLREYDWDRDVVDVTQDALAKADLEGDTRTVVLTDCAIEIINPHPKTVIRPFAKPKYRSPLDRPVYFPQGHKAVLPKFPSTQRFSTAVNRIATVDVATSRAAHRRCKEMLRGAKDAIQPFILRYDRPFDPVEPTLLVRGLSFRGRGHLDVRMGWSTVTEITAEGVGDIANASAGSGENAGPMYSAAGFSRRTTEKRQQLEQQQQQQAIQRRTTFTASRKSTLTAKQEAPLQEDTISVWEPRPSEAASARYSKAEALVSSPESASAAQGTNAAAAVVQMEIARLPILPTKSVHTASAKSAADPTSARDGSEPNPWASGSPVKRDDSAAATESAAGEQPASADKPSAPKSRQSSFFELHKPSTHDFDKDDDGDDDDDEWIREQKRALFGGWQHEPVVENPPAAAPAPAILSTSRGRTASFTGRPSRPNTGVQRRATLDDQSPPSSAALAAGTTTPPAQPDGKKNPSKPTSITDIAKPLELPSRFDALIREQQAATLMSIAKQTTSGESIHASPASASQEAVAVTTVQSRVSVSIEIPAALSKSASPNASDAQTGSAHDAQPPRTFSASSQNPWLKDSPAKQPAAALSSHDDRPAAGLDAKQSAATPASMTQSIDDTSAAWASVVSPAVNAPAIAATTSASPQKISPAAATSSVSPAAPVSQRKASIESVASKADGKKSALGKMRGWSSKSFDSLNDRDSETKNGEQAATAASTNSAAAPAPARSATSETHIFASPRDPLVSPFPEPPEVPAAQATSAASASAPKLDSSTSKSHEKLGVHAQQSQPDLAASMSSGSKDKDKDKKKGLAASISKSLNKLKHLGDHKEKSHKSKEKSGDDLNASVNKSVAPDAFRGSSSKVDLAPEVQTYGDVRLSVMVEHPPVEHHSAHASPVVSPELALQEPAVNAKPAAMADKQPSVASLPPAMPAVELPFKTPSVAITAETPERGDAAAKQDPSPSSSSRMGALTASALPSPASTSNEASSASTITKQIDSPVREPVPSLPAPAAAKTGEPTPVEPVVVVAAKPSFASIDEPSRATIEARAQPAVVAPAVVPVAVNVAPAVLEPVAAPDTRGIAKMDRPKRPAVSHADASGAPPPPEPIEARKTEADKPKVDEDKNARPIEQPSHRSQDDKKPTSEPPKHEDPHERASVRQSIAAPADPLDTSANHGRPSQAGTENNIKVSDKHRSAHFASSIVKGLKKSSQNLSSKFGGSKHSLAAASTESLARHRESTSGASTAPPALPSETAAKIQYENMDIKISAKSSRFLNAMDVHNIQSAAGGGLESRDPADEAVKKAEPQKPAEDSKPVDQPKAAEPPKPVELPKPLKNIAKVSFKGSRCDIKIVDFELHCFEPGKTKIFKPYYPIELRRVIGVGSSGTEIHIDACITREGGKPGGKLKHIAFEAESAAAAKQWADNTAALVFGGVQAESMARSVLILVEKSDKESGKMIEKHVKEVIEASRRPLEIKTVQYNEFSVANVLAAVDFKKLGNIFCTNSDFVPRVQQLLVRERYCSNPVVLPCEADPVDAALAIVRSSVGKSNLKTLFVSGVSLKREESSKLSGFLNKFK